MALSNQRAQAQLNTTATNLFDVVNTSGVTLGNLHFANVDPSNQVQLFVSIVPTGSTMGSGNGILWNVGLGASGAFSVSQPMFMASGDKLQASGSSAGLNAYITYLKLN